MSSFNSMYSNDNANNNEASSEKDSDDEEFWDDGTTTTNSEFNRLREHVSSTSMASSDSGGSLSSAMASSNISSPTTGKIRKNVSFAADGDGRTTINNRKSTKSSNTTNNQQQQKQYSSNNSIVTPAESSSNYRNDIAMKMNARLKNNRSKTTNNKTNYDNDNDDKKKVANTNNNNNTRKNSDNNRKTNYWGNISDDSDGGGKPTNVNNNIMPKKGRNNTRKNGTTDTNKRVMMDDDIEDDIDDYESDGSCGPQYARSSSREFTMQQQQHRINNDDEEEETRPGAYYTQGRAIGNMPAWARLRTAVSMGGVRHRQHQQQQQRSQQQDINHHAYSGDDEEKQQEDSDALNGTAGSNNEHIATAYLVKSKRFSSIVQAEIHDTSEIDEELRINAINARRQKRIIMILFISIIIIVVAAVSAVFAIKNSNGSDNDNVTRIENELVVFVQLGDEPESIGWNITCDNDVYFSNKDVVPVGTYGKSNSNRKMVHWMKERCNHPSHSKDKVTTCMFNITNDATITKEEQEKHNKSIGVEIYHGNHIKSQDNLLDLSSNLLLSHNSSDASIPKQFIIPSTFSPMNPPTPPPTATEANIDDDVNEKEITLIIQLDDYPQETSWKLECNNSTIKEVGVGIKEVGVGTYSLKKYGLINETFTILSSSSINSSACKFTIYDSFGDGLRNNVFKYIFDRDDVVGEAKSTTDDCGLQVIDSRSKHAFNDNGYYALYINNNTLIRRNYHFKNQFNYTDTFDVPMSTSKEEESNIINDKLLTVKIRSFDFTDLNKEPLTWVVVECHDDHIDEFVVKSFTGNISETFYVTDGAQCKLSIFPEMTDDSSNGVNMYDSLLSTKGPYGIYYGNTSNKFPILQDIFYGFHEVTFKVTDPSEDKFSITVISDSQWILKCRTNDDDDPLLLKGNTSKTTDNNLTFGIDYHCSLEILKSKNGKESMFAVYLNADFISMDNKQLAIGHYVANDNTDVKSSFVIPETFFKLVPVVVVIRLGMFPEQIGWKLECNGLLLANIGKGSSSWFDQRLVQEKVFVKVGQTCTFTVLSNSDNDSSSIYRIYLDDPSYNKQVTIGTSEGNVTVANFTTPASIVDLTTITISIRPTNISQETLSWSLICDNLTVVNFVNVTYSSSSSLNNENLITETVKTEKGRKCDLAVSINDGDDKFCSENVTIFFGDSMDNKKMPLLNSTEKYACTGSKCTCSGSFNVKDPHR